jgi:protein CWC15
MTTAARPTWEPAKGGNMRGETNLGMLSKQVSTRDLPTQLTLKYRGEGQGHEESYVETDYKRELVDRERKAREDKNREKAYRGSGGASTIAGSIAPSRHSTSHRKNVDADDPVDNSDDDSSDEEDETADLLAELNKIKAERAAENKREEERQVEEEERIRKDAILSGNPLLQKDGEPAKKSNFGVKRRWDDDVVFKNCARAEPEKKKNFVNDTIRSDFHRRFMYKYIK